MSRQATTIIACETWSPDVATIHTLILKLKVAQGAMLSFKLDKIQNEEIIEIAIGRSHCSLKNRQRLGNHEQDDTQC